ncbi:hypothetical protein [Yoonia sp.]
MIDPFRRTPLRQRVTLTVRLLVVALGFCVLVFALRQAGWV